MRDAQEIGPQLTHEAVARLSEHAGEPEWLRHRRLFAWDCVRQLPMPNPGSEAWRRTDFSWLHPETTRVFQANGHPAAALPAPWQGVMQAEDPDQITLFQRNFRVVRQRLPEALARAGVIVTDVWSLLKHHPNFLREYLMQDIVSPKEGKLQAWHLALLAGGAVVYIPSGVKVDRPIHLGLFVDANTTGTLTPHTLIVAERDSECTILDEYVSDAGDARRLSCGVVEIVARPNAQVRYINLQRWAPDVVHVHLQRVQAQRDSQIQTALVGLGGAVTKSQLEVQLAQPGARSELLGLFFGAGDQQFDANTFQNHIAKQTESDLLFKAALRDRSRSAYYGLIHIHPGAQQTAAYQANRNLLLGEGAKADSVPVLEIEADDVRCKHGATVGPLDEEPLFYLAARGIDRPTAESLLTYGFLEEVLGRIRDPAAQAYVSARVAEKVGGASETLVKAPRPMLEEDLVTVTKEAD